jgi:hypothetical protein
MSGASGHLKDSSGNGISGSAIDEKIHCASCFSPPVGDVCVICRRRSLGGGKGIVSNACPGKSKSTSIRPLLIAKAILRVSISSSDVTVIPAGDWISTQNKFKRSITRDRSKIEELDICSIEHGRRGQNRRIGQNARTTAVVSRDRGVIGGQKTLVNRSKSAQGYKGDRAPRIITADLKLSSGAT